MAKKKSLDYNYAQDFDFAESIKMDLLTSWQHVRGEREQREDIWQESYRAWSVDRTDSDKQYDGRANLYLPQIRKEVETMTRRIYKGLFPDDYLKADPNRLEDEELTFTNTQVVRHYLDNVMKIKSFAMPWVKQGVIYGTSPARIFWREDVNKQFFKERYFVDNEAGILEPKTKVVYKDVVNYRAPDMRAEDLYQTWIYPHNADKPENIKKVFWRTKTSKSELKKKEKAKMCTNLEKLEGRGKTEDWEFRRSTERLQQFGQSGFTRVEQKEELYTLLEVWLDLWLPGEEMPVPCVVEIIDESVVTRIQRNPYWDQKPPFAFMRFIIPPPGEFYGRGLPEASISVQHQINDTLNQTMDSVTLSLNNITVVNPAYAPNAESFEIEPGAMWWADPAAVKQMQFPDLSNSGIKNVGLLRGIVTEMSDNSPQLPDPIAGKARSTGQAQLAVNEWQTDLFTILDSITEEAMNPLAKKVHTLLQQNLTDDEVIRIAGKYSGKWVERIVTPDQLVGNYNFKWIGALKIENQAVKTQQMLNFMKLFGSLPPDSGVKMKWDNFVIKLIRDGFLINDPENLIETKELTQSVEPALEHKILALKGEISVQDSDDDEKHLPLHQEELDTIKDKYQAAKLAEHMNKHVEQMERKKLEIQQAQMMMEMQMQMSGKGQAGPGNQGQISEASDGADLERGLGV
jgi:hypothetical protein